MTWREMAAPIIQRILEETAALPESEVRRRLREAYPFAARVGHPYRIWREEIQRQGGPHRSRSSRIPSKERTEGEEPPPAQDLPPAALQPQGRRRRRSDTAEPPGPSGQRAETGSVPGTGDPAPPLAGTAPREARESGVRRSRPPEPRQQAVRESFFVEDRVEHLPAGPCCGQCRHLGALLSVTDFRGIKRLRRACPVHPLGFTAPDWPACPAFEPPDSPGGR